MNYTIKRNLVVLINTLWWGMYLCGAIYGYKYFLVPWKDFFPGPVCGLIFIPAVVVALEIIIYFYKPLTFTEEKKQYKEKCFYLSGVIYVVYFLIYLKAFF